MAAPSPWNSPHELWSAIHKKVERHLGRRSGAPVGTQRYTKGPQGPAPCAMMSTFVMIT